MTEAPESEEKHWFVLNFIRKSGKPSPQDYIDDFNKTGQRIELFAPIIRLARIVEGKVAYKEQLLTFFYVFVKGTLADVKELCARPDNNLSLMLDRGSDKRYGIISDSDMENFKIIARVHTNTIPFFNIDEIELQKGDIVEVVDGDYAGLRGTFMPKSRSNKGNLVISATAAMGAVLWNIDAKFVRILEFARDTRRQYDLLDSFIPKLFPILRKFHAEERLTDKEKSMLAVFNRRMGVVSPDNHKVEAKLLATLMCVQTIIGDTSGYERSAQRFAKRKAAVTNPWTLALIDLMMSVAQNNMPQLKKSYEKLTFSSDNLTKPQSQLLKEFQYYI